MKATLMQRARTKKGARPTAEALAAAQAAITRSKAICARVNATAARANAGRKAATPATMARPKLADVDLRRVPRGAFKMVTR